MYELATADGSFDLTRLQAIDTFIRTFDDLAPLNFLLDRIDLSRDTCIVDIISKNEVFKLKTQGFIVVNLMPDVIHFPSDMVGFSVDLLDNLDEILPKKWVEDFERKSKVKLALRGFFLVKLPYGFFTYSISNDRFYVEALYTVNKQFRLMKDFIVNFAKSLGYEEVYWITHRNGEAFAKISGGEVIAYILKYEVK